MDFFLLLFVIFVIIGPLAGYQRYSSAQRIGSRHQPAGLPGPSPFQQPGYGQPYGAGYSASGHTPMSAPQQPIPLSPEAFAASKDALGEDITSYGTELRDLDLEVVGRELTAAANDDYTRALDAYDGAKATLERARGSEDLRRVAEILEEGRFAVAAVKARVNGEPLPERRPPCFFDPAHGPSTEDVMWAPAGGAPRKVPACARDAQRVGLGADPYIRMVGFQGQMQPYWENKAYVPYAQGYYARYDMDPTMRSLAQSAIVFGGLGLLFGMFGD